MKQYHLVYGGIGAVVLILLSVLGVYNASSGFGVGCLISLLIPLVIGALIPRAAKQVPSSSGQPKGTGQLALEGGIAAGIAGLLGGLVTSIIGYVQANNALSSIGGIGGASADIISILLVGVVVLAIIYFILGLVGGFVGSAMGNA